MERGLLPVMKKTYIHIKKFQNHLKFDNNISII